MSFSVNPIKTAFSLFDSVVDFILKIKDRREDRKKSFYKNEIEPLFVMSRSAVDDIFKMMHKFENCVEPHLKCESYLNDGAQNSILLKDNITKLLSEFTNLREARLSNRVDLLRRVKVIQSMMEGDTLEDEAIRNMMDAINYLVEGKDGDGSGSRPRSLLDVLRLIEEYREEMPDWVKVKLGSPHLRSQLKDCEWAWGEVCTLNEQLRYFFHSGKRPSGGYRKPQFFKQF